MCTARFSDLSIQANGCSGTSGVIIDYAIEIQYPESVWEGGIMGTKAGNFLDPTLKRKMLVVNRTVMDARNPEFSLATLAALAGEGVACATPGHPLPPAPGPAPVGAPPPPDCAQNVSGLMLQTGTDVTFKINGIEGAGYTDKGPGLALGMTAEITLLSEKNSALCKGNKPFCCAWKDPGSDGPDCCCPTYPPDAACNAAEGSISSSQCSSTNGQTTQCSDAEWPKNDPTKVRFFSHVFLSSCLTLNSLFSRFFCLQDQKNHPEKWVSDCATFKKAVYNFTYELGAQRIDLYPDSASIEAVPIDILQFFYAEMCDKNIGQNRDLTNCPGLGKGKQWMWGDPLNKDGKGLVKIGAIGDPHTGDIGGCDGLFPSLYRKVGVWGIIGIILLVVVILVGLGFCGYTYYMKVKRAKEFPNLDVGINDPGAGTNADFAYADIDSVVS